ncbi:MAG: PD-(D/E)XK nuclease family protein [Bacillota bacterium]|nr:PD-(D/E)XK nuclease family protein [Bacillota bacterium]
MRIIAGRAGSGKSRRITQEIGKIIKDKPLGEIILIVPDQFTYEAERNLMSSLGLKGLMGLEVLSFSRLAHRVISLCGGGARTYIDMTGKSMLIRRILSENTKKLKIYGTMADMPGFAPKMAEALSDLKRFDIAPSDLHQKTLLLEDRVLSDKLEDMALLYEAFENRLKDGYADAEDKMNIFIEELPVSGFLTDAHVFIDGFEMLTKQVYRALEKIFLCSDELTITLRMEKKENAPDAELFRPEKKLYDLLCGIARAHGTEPETIWLPQEDTEWRTADPGLRHLEKELFALRALPYSEEPSALTIRSLKNPLDEVEHAAAFCMLLAQDEGYRWRNMAIACNALQRYGPIIKRVFARYGIPCFLDAKRPMSDHPAIQYINASLRAATRGYAQADVLRALKTGFSPLDSEESDIFENHVLQHGIKGEGFFRAFADKAAEAARHTLIPPLLRLGEGLRAETAAGKCRALYRFLLGERMPEKLRAFQALLEERGMLEEAGETGQVWGKTVQLLDQMFELAGDSPLPPLQFAKMLQSGFESVEIGIIPTTADQVLIGDIGRTMSHTINALLVLGVNDGVLPSGRYDEGLLLDEELSRLEKRGLYAGRGREEKAAQEAMDIYTAFSKPKKLLYLSYSLADGEGKAASPSLIIERLKGLFPLLKIQSSVQMEGSAPPPVGASGSLTHMADMMRQAADTCSMPREWWTAFKWYESGDWRRKILEYEKALFCQNIEQGIGRERAAELYGKTGKLSVSRMESYGSCPFKHFVKYGLRPSERKEYGIKPVDIGAYLHKAMEEFVNAVCGKEIAWEALDEPVIANMIGEITGKLNSGGEFGIDTSDAKHVYLASRLKKAFKRSIWAITQHMKQGRFVPLATEMEFGDGKTLPPLRVELASGQTFIIEGKIDRVDICSDGTVPFLRVVDYKTGESGIDWALAEMGLRLQLAIYADALMQDAARLAEKGAKLGGMLYFRIDDPLIDTQERAMERIQQEMKKRFRMDGLVLKDTEAVQKMGGGECVGASLKVDGSVKEGSGVADEAQVEAFIAFAREAAKKAFTGIYSGEIGISPIRKGGTLISCDSCDYRAICAYDERFGGNKPRSAGSQGKKAFFEKRAGKGGIEK